MESQVLSEEVEWEARRVAAAFGVLEPQIIPTDESVPVVDMEGYAGTIFVEWTIDKAKGVLEDVGVGPVEGVPCCHVYTKEGDKGLIAERCFLNRPWCDAPWQCCDDSSELMVRGLFCLGIEEGETIIDLNSPLTAHEKLELRLSLPREFWPKAWLDE